MTKFLKDQKTRKQYFSENGYTLLFWALSLVLIWAVYDYIVKYDYLGFWFILIPVILISAIVLILVLGNRAYKNYLKI
jgi:hypothetical protein